MFVVTLRWSLWSGGGGEDDENSTLAGRAGSADLGLKLYDCEKFRL